MSYKKRKDGRYQRLVTVGIKDGKPERISVYGKTLKELDENYRKVKALQDKGVVLKSNRISVRELSEAWLENVKRPGLKRQSYTNLKSQIKILNGYIGHIRVKDLSIKDIEAYRKQVLGKGHYDQYNKALACLRSVLDYGIQQDIIVRNVTSGIKPVRPDSVKKKRALTAHEKRLVLSADLNPWEEAFVKTLFFAGVRRNEALALEKEDIDLKRGIVRICKTIVNSTGEIQNTPKTEAGNRYVHIPAPLSEVYQRYLPSLKTDCLFPARNGCTIKAGTFHKRWRNICLKIFKDEPVPEDFTPHLFRHNYASDLYRAGMDVKAAQYLLGHTDIKTTLDVYTHFGKDDIDTGSIDRYYRNCSQIVVNGPSNKKSRARNSA